MRRASAPVLILVILILIALSLAGGGFYLLQKEKAKTLDLADKLEEIGTKQRMTEAKLKDSQDLIAELQSKLKEAKTQIDSLSNDLQAEKKARLESQAKIEQVRLDLEQQKNLRSDLENKLNQAQDESRKTQAHLKELESKKLELEAKIKDFEAKSQGVELGNIVVSQEAASAVTPNEKRENPAMPVSVKSEKNTAGKGLEGKVLVVNKDYNFAVISLGEKNGINVGDVFSIYHNNRYVGDVKVEKVHDSMAAAGFVSQDIKDKVSEGDKVVQKVK